MVPKMIVLALCVVGALGSAVAPRYPAGVNPHSCPNYPYCDTVAAHSALQAAPHHGAAAAYPAGVDPHACPNYPYCDNVALAARAAGHGWAAPAHGAWAAAPLSAWTGVAPGGWAGSHGVVHGVAHGVAPAAARYPAGVNPHACPNYPYCH